MSKAWIAGLLASLALPAAAWATGVRHGSIGHYDALISDADHYNSEGIRLRDATAIIRQDRANVHRHGIVDDADGYDYFFSNPNARAALERMLSVGELSQADEVAIVSGVVRVHVDIFPNSVRVKVW
ncbi:MAG: hypothetical protein H7X93_08130 [Sphingomonadaceae bacterium]|nr:hypothetical protein [Sphingomonadaceae bacterium]